MLVVENNSVYEIDEECLKKKQEEKAEIFVLKMKHDRPLWKKY